MEGGMLTTFDVADIYTVHPNTARRWCRRGYFPGAVKVWWLKRLEWRIPNAALGEFEPPKCGRPRKK